MRGRAFRLDWAAFGLATAFIAAAAWHLSPVAAGAATASPIAPAGLSWDEGGQEPAAQAVRPDASAGTGSTLLVPNGGERWYQGVKYQVKWTLGWWWDSVKLSLYRGRSWMMDLASETFDDGSYDWRIPAVVPPGTDYRIRVISPMHPGVWDASDAPFTIKQPLLTVLTPRTGAVVRKGRTVQVTWTSKGTLGDVSIVLLDRGAVKQIINPRTANNGSFWWLVPTSLPNGTNYRVRVLFKTNPRVFDDGGLFKIQP